MKKTTFSTIFVKVILPVFVGIFVAVGAYFILGDLNQNTIDEQQNQSFEFEEDQTREENESTVSSGIEIPGYSTITIPSSETDVSVNFYNPENNNVYFEISLILTETSEEIYKSNLLSPSQHLYEITLNRELESGEYDMTILYNTYSMDENFIPKNGATVNCILKVA
ncbi:MAG: hypothetical protein R3Y35_06775 [Clostridia bacterium]